MTDPIETSDTVETLILDLLEWVALRERTYEETMDAWRTSCPKLPVWEDATDLRLVTTELAGGRSLVRVTESGLAFLDQRRPAARIRIPASCRTASLVPDRPK